MRCVLLLVAVLIMLALGASGALAHTTIISPPGSPWPYQRWVDEAKVPTPDVTLWVEEYSEGTDFTSPDFALIGMHPVPPFRFIRSEFYHELGHQFDYNTLPDWARARYMAILGLAGEWRQEVLQSGSPHELFAESYALCAIRPRLHPRGLILEQEPVGGWRVHNRVCRMLRRLA